MGRLTLRRRFDRAYRAMLKAGGVAVRTDAVLVGHLEEIRKRLGDARAVLTVIKSELGNAEIYEKPDRFRRDRMPRGRGFGPGYKGHQTTPRLSGRLAVEVGYTRRAAPRVSDETIQRWVRTIALFAIKGNVNGRSR